MLIAGSTPLEDFLSDSSSSTDTGELLQRIGLFGSLFGLTLAVGSIVFLALVHRGPRREVAAVLRLVAVAGGLVLVGAAIEVAGVASIGGLSWSDALTDGTGSAAMMRFLAGLMIVLGFFDDTAPVDERADLDGSVDAPEALADVDRVAGAVVAPDAGATPDATDVRAARANADPDAVADPIAGAVLDTTADPGVDAASLASAERDAVADGDVRWVPSSASAFGLVGGAVGVMSFWFDGHTVTEGPRVVHAVVDAAHVLAGSVWFGGLVALVLIGLLRRRSGRSIAPLVVRFSSIATAALIIVVLAGSLMTLLIIDGFGDLTGTPWGRLLLVKVAAVGVTVLFGAYNHFAVVPALERADVDVDMEARARATLTVEAAILVFVVALTVLLTSASPN